MVAINLMQNGSVKTDVLDECTK